MSWCGIGSHSTGPSSPFRLFLKWIALNTSVVHLDLAYNNISESDGMELAKVLLPNSTLRCV